MTVLDSTSSTAAASPGATVTGSGFRITVLTSRLLRLERQEDDLFTDECTQLVQSRQFEVPNFTVSETEDTLDLWTEHLHLRYDKRQFSPSGLSISMRQRTQGSHFTTWQYGDPAYAPDGRTANLGGTARTLDDIDGAVQLEPGILSKYGYAVVDDSKSLVLTGDNWVTPRPALSEDLYFFGYGLDFDDALRDYFVLTGPNPLLPRWALGNWWSRFHAYSAQEYLDLMDRFRDAGLPFSVAVIDMDWHLVDIPPELGTGWTGYTWNPALFPNPEEFLRKLGDRNLRVTLNVHPADGVRRHEAAYSTVAGSMGMDPTRGLEVAFDITSREFVDAYFRYLHHPHEEIGVDFWWVDWQSGDTSRTPGLDPLWMLNHLHYLDSGRSGKRPLTFSRYAGLGSHRYPIGFSGDTVTTWDSLNFQPYFTATAANVGYHWWSHDIGGHLGGTKDDELATRWFQLGVFSPINRLHSAGNLFNSKEPGRFGVEAQQVMSAFLRLRHQLVPYLYTAMWASHTDGIAPIRPMYHADPSSGSAYEVPNQYMFGADLVVAPITTPADRLTKHAGTTAWLPDGTWFDFTTGRRYAGGRMLRVHRTLEEMPLFAPAGAIIPLAADPMADAGSAPDALELVIFSGASGAYLMVEDDGGPENAVVRHETQISFEWSKREQDLADARLTIASNGGGLRKRAVTLRIVGVVNGEVLIGESSVIPMDSPSTGSLLVDLGVVDVTAGVTVELHGMKQRLNHTEEDVFALLDQAQISYDLKTTVLHAVQTHEPLLLVAALQTLDLPGNLFDVLLELVGAAPTP